MTPSPSRQDDTDWAASQDREAAGVFWRMQKVPIKACVRKTCSWVTDWIDGSVPGEGNLTYWSVVGDIFIDFMHLLNGQIREGDPRSRMRVGLKKQIEENLDVLARLHDPVALAPGEETPYEVWKTRLIEEIGVPVDETLIDVVLLTMGMLVDLSHLEPGAPVSDCRDTDRILDIIASGGLDHLTVLGRGQVMDHMLEDGGRDHASPSSKGNGSGADPDIPF